MLKDNLVNYIQRNGKNPVELPELEMEYVKTHQLPVEVVEQTEPRFLQCYMELGEKETEESESVESVSSFLQHSIAYFKEHKNQFMYVESEYFAVIGVDGICLEVDDVFGNYNVMLGLKLAKKYSDSIRSFLHQQLVGENHAFDLMFDANEGIWNFNFSLNALPNFQEEWTISEAYDHVYAFLFRLQEEIETLSK